MLYRNGIVVIIGYYIEIFSEFLKSMQNIHYLLIAGGLSSGI